MQENKGFPCKWTSCTSSFVFESELFTHIKNIHIQIAQPISCNWVGYSSTAVYTRGHLADHTQSHMSKGFRSIWCAGCKTGLRNRQALSRHQAKTGCVGSCNKCQGDDPLSKVFFKLLPGKPLPFRNKIIICMRLGKDEGYVMNPEPPGNESANWRVMEDLQTYEVRCYRHSL
jgi:hypothetical protein